MYKKKLISIVLAMVFSMSINFVCEAKAASTIEPPMIGNVKTTIVKTGQQVDSVSRKFINMWSSIIPAIQTIVASDGSISILNIRTEDNTIQIYEFDASGQFIRTLSITKELPLVGGFTRDEGGNYYVLYAKDVDEGSFTEKNMELVQYSPNAEKIKAFYLEAQTTDEIWAEGYSGVKTPFAAGNCKIEISGDMIAVYFGRIMFVSVDGLNHQASHGFILNINTFERLTGNGENMIQMPSAGHSFNQYILPIKDGFMFVDHGDNGPRAFMFSSITKTQSKSINSFEFKKNKTYQNTFAEMGEIAETENGYIFAGTYEKSVDVSSSHNDSRNVFVITMDKNLNTISTPIWITNYINKDEETAIFPKITRIGRNKYLLLWSVYSPSGSSGNENTYYTIIDKNGNLIKAITSLPYAPLNGFDTLRYSPVTGLVHWAVEEGNDCIALYSFNPNKDPLPIQSINSASNWAKDTIGKAIYAQIIPSDLQEKYTNNITRGEFCHMAVQYVETIKGYTIDTYLKENNININADAFTDTKDIAILSANALGIVSGIGNNKFDPDGFITREQAAIMITNMQKSLGYKTVDQIPMNFSDRKIIASWAIGGVNYVSAKGIMNGVGGNRFDPQGLYTREQAIVTFYNVLTK